MMCAQQSVAKPVESTDPHATRVNRQHRRDASEHLARGFIGICDCQYRQGFDLISLDQPRDSRRQYTGFSGAGTCQNERGLVRQRDRCQLFGIEAFQNL